jgi:drug/metabolite transporter (DMT)-like permease
MIGMTILNPLCGVLAMNYASPSIVAPFSGLTLVWIVMFSDILVGEPPSFKQVVAASLIVLGEIVVAIFGDHTNDEGVTLEDLTQSYREPSFIAYLVGITIWMGFVFCWVNFANSDSLRRFAWGVAGGSITGIQNFLKDGLTILKANEGLPWYSPVFFMLAALAAFGGLLLLMACMKRYDVTYSSAMFVGAFVVSASAMSAAHYDTLAHLEKPINYVLYPLGLMILMAGVCILATDTKDVGDDTPKDKLDEVVRYDSLCCRLCSFVGYARLVGNGQHYGSTKEPDNVLNGTPFTSYNCLTSTDSGHHERDLPKQV